MTHKPYAYILHSRDIPKHQGLGMLPHSLKNAGLAHHVGWKDTAFNRGLMKVLRTLSPSRFSGDREYVYNSLYTKFLLLKEGRKGRFIQFAWGDKALQQFSNPERFIFTVHLPHEDWSPADWSALCRAEGVITMAEREREAIQARKPAGLVVCIPHGVATDFWKPGVPATDGPLQVVILGRYMRNYEMITRVSSSLLQRNANIRIKWLVNPDFVLSEALQKTLPRDRFHLVRNLSENELLALYQESHLMFTPYNNVTASNSIVEALSCGLPIVTTRVGGMESYGGDRTMMLVENNNDQSAVDAVEAFLTDADRRTRYSKAARQFAVEELDWSVVVERQRKFYQQLQTLRSQNGRT